jgi:hypothetical protein
MAMVKDYRTRSYIGYYYIPSLPLVHSFIFLPAVLDRAALVANAFQFSLSAEQNDKSAGYIKQIIPVETPL